jgi:ABC-2 type transport system permease protein
MSSADGAGAGETGPIGTGANGAAMTRASGLPPVVRRRGIARHVMPALVAIVGREVSKFLRQPGRLVSSVVRPALWLIVFASGFQNVFGVSIIPPYETYVEYKVYLTPGLVGMVLLFNGMLSSLAMVYDREMGMMRLLLTAPLSRGVLLFGKLLAGAFLSLLQAVVFLLVAILFGVDITITNLLLSLPVIVLGALMLAALGLVLSVNVRQLENFAGTMNFVIFPMFFISSALYPLWKLQESGATWVWQLARFNPFTYAIEAIRFSLVGQFNTVAVMVTAVVAVALFAIALVGYDPQRGLMKRGGPPGGA